MRVADLLIADNDDDYHEDPTMFDNGPRARREGGCINFECSSPRLILSRWVSSYKRSNERRSLLKSEKVDRERRRKKVISDRSIRVRSSMNGSNAGESSSSLISEESKGDCAIAELSGLYRKEISFNLGVGFGLIFLISASKNELNKMMELRTQMETILQNVKEESQRKDTLSKLPESNDNIAHSTSDAQEGLDTNGHLSIQNGTLSNIVPNSETSIQSMKYNPCCQEECVEGMDQLEAELEAELERLQLHLDTEDLSKHPQHKSIEMTVEDTALGGSLSASFGEVIDPQEADTGEQCGVPPDELKRRLHDLLAARQQERIEELEAALECAKNQLREKDLEVSWWKDTARLISEHVPAEASHLLR